MRSRVRCSSDSAKDSWFHNSALRLPTITGLHCPSVDHFAPERSLVTYPGDILPAWPADNSPKSSRRGRGVCLAGMKSSCFRRGSLGSQVWLMESFQYKQLADLRVPSWRCPCHFHRHTQPILINLCLQCTPKVRTCCALTKWRTEEETERNNINKEAILKWVIPKLFSKACVKVWNIYTAILKTYRVSNSKIGILRIPGRMKRQQNIDTGWISSVGLWAKTSKFKSPMDKGKK